MNGGPDEGKCITIAYPRRATHLLTISIVADAIMLLTYTLSLAFATQVAQASRLQILSTSNVINAVNDFVPQTPEKLFLGGCSPERAAIVQQAYTDAITIATQAADSLNDPNRPAQVTSLFNKLFNFVIDGVSQSEAVQTILSE